QKIMATIREKFSLEDILAAFQKITERKMKRAGKNLAPEKLFGLFLAVAAYKNAQAELAEDLRAVKQTIGLLKRDIAQINRTRIRWLREYGFELFPLLFDLTFEEYIKSPLFWNALKRK
ncbi:MAG: hypothetical protein ABIH22_00715, partial [Candidatus Margulisiibacteriota bacterium]